MAWETFQVQIDKPHFEQKTQSFKQLLTCPIFNVGTVVILLISVNSETFVDFVCFVVAWLIQQPRKFAQALKTFKHSSRNRKRARRICLENESLDALFEHLNVEIDEKPNSDIGKLHVR